MEITAARTLEAPALARVFNAGFAEYVVPLTMSEAALAEHLEVNDIDLGCSRVIADPEPVSFALIGRRGDDAWVGGMGTAPSHRGRGLGERVLRAAIDAAAQDGARTVWLEVIDRNRAAIALYEKLGFERVRDLVVWSVPALAASSPVRPDDRAGSDEAGPDDAHAWIVTHRSTREPWQRADAVIQHHRRRGADVRGLTLGRSGAETAAAVVLRRRGDAAAVLQIAASDARAAADVLRAAVAGSEELRASNVPVDGPVSEALLALGARELVRQHELRLAV